MPAKEALSEKDEGEPARRFSLVLYLRRKPSPRRTPPVNTSDERRETHELPKRIAAPLRRHRPPLAGRKDAGPGRGRSAARRRHDGAAAREKPGPRPFPGRSPGDQIRREKVRRAADHQRPRRDRPGLRRRRRPSRTGRRGSARGTPATWPAQNHRRLGPQRGGSRRRRTGRRRLPRLGGVVSDRHQGQRRCAATGRAETHRRRRLHSRRGHRRRHGGQHAAAERHGAVRRGRRLGDEIFGA